jgi:CheY-like chemotaxis protein
LFSRNGIRFEVDVESRPLHVHGDATRLAQVVGNLLDNAAKFTPAGGRVDVRVGEEHGRAVVRVEDTGAGLDSALVGRLFEPFVQSEQTLDRSRGGLGLGLSLVKGLVELQGGTVEARSEGLGRGAAFIIGLPLERRAASRLSVVPSHEAPRAPRRRVLVVEDNPDAAETLKSALEMGGHVVETVATGPEALALARKLPPDVVLCDIGLPGMDGYDVARAFRSDPALQGIALIALSGYASPDDVERAHTAGFDRHLAKPVDIESIESVLTSSGEGSAVAGLGQLS